MPVVCLDMGCTGSSVVAEAREIPWVCRNRRRTLLGRFPTADFVFTPYGRVGGNSCLAPGISPSCGAKRAAIFSELPQQQILADVPHAQWVFTIPKMLRPYFLHHRELLGNMATIAYETIREMMAAAVDEPDARPGMVGVIQTFGSSLKWNPHIHAIVSRGVWSPDGEWHPIPYVDSHKAELVFRHKLLCLLRDRGLVSEERIELLLSSFRL